MSNYHAMILDQSVFPIAVGILVAAASAYIVLKPKARPEGSPPIAPHANPILGHIFELLKGSLVFCKTMFEGVDSNVVALSLLFGFNGYLVRGPEYARKVFMSSANSRYANPEGLKNLNMDHGILFNSDIPTWKRNRKILIESIARPRFICSLAPKINQSLKQICVLLDSLEEKQPSTPVLANLFFNSISLDVIFDIVVSENRHTTESYLISLQDQQQGKKIKDQEKPDVLIALIHGSMDAVQFFLSVPRLFYTYLPGYIRKAAKHRQVIHEWNAAIQSLIDQKVLEISSNSSDWAPALEDLMTALLLGCDATEKLSILHVIKEAIGGGTDTSSNTMSFMLYELAKNPTITQEIYGEICKHVGLVDDFTAENITQLKLLEATINETLRLHLVVPATQRKLSNDLVLDNYTLKSGGIVFVTTQENHISQDLWEEPLVFNPWRFLSDHNKKDLGGPLGFGFAFVPFGYGVRKCPGEALAMMEMKLVMANLIRKYTFTLANPSEPLKFRETLTVECLDLPVFFRHRSEPPIAPYGYPVIGHLLTWIQGPEITGQKLFEGIDGDIVQFHIFSLQFYMLRGREYPKKLLTSSHLNLRFVNPAVLDELNIRGKGLLLNNDIESWKRNRKILVESIGRPRFLRSLAPKINANLGALFEILDQLDQQGTSILANVLFGGISLDVIFDIIFSEHRRAAETYLSSLVRVDLEGGSGKVTVVEHRGDEIVDLLHDAFEATQFFVRTPRLLYKWHPTYIAKAKKLKQATIAWREYTENLTKEKKAQFELEGSSSDADDLSTTLFRGDGTLDEIAQVVRETIGGGTDTSSNTMAFLTYELAKNQTIADGIYNEIVENVGLDADFTNEDIGKLPYLEAAIHETTRLHAVARFAARYLSEEVDVGDYKLKKGAVALAGIQLNQEYSKLWDSPVEFNPSRFLESKELGGPLGFGFAHFPFGYGVRKCPGEALALTEMKLVMANLIRRYKFVLVDPSKPLQKKKDSLTLECLDLPVYFKRR
ncbi:UNVERIFIED_CONTAM: hypothetical protein HDU68_000430 [Siphonaria sp. JEL0065]|nr:hypothetical protein HDU68_000430 [Siphonaria sp. JEL0065]